MKKPQQLFVTGIGTGVGKTVCSAVLVEYFQADYWKPLQSGDLESSDSIQMSQMVNKNIKIHPERYRLKLAASPHKSAKAEGITIQLQDFHLPSTDNSLIVEGAGGLFVPIAHRVYLCDLIRHFCLPVVLVARDYLGCINHTLLTLAALKEKNIQLSYFVWNGAFDPDTRQAIAHFLYLGTRVMQLPDLGTPDHTNIKETAKNIKIQTI